MKLTVIDLKKAIFIELDHFNRIGEMDGYIFVMLCPQNPEYDMAWTKTFYGLEDIEVNHALDIIQRLVRGYKERPTEPPEKEIEYEYRTELG